MGQAFLEPQAYFFFIEIQLWSCSAWELAFVSVSRYFFYIYFSVSLICLYVKINIYLLIHFVHK